MKNFFKYMFASMLGTFLSFFLLLFVFGLIVAGILTAAMADFTKGPAATKVEEKSVLHVKLDRPITDRGPAEHFQFNFGPFQGQSGLGLDQIVKNLEKAKDDDHIEGIYLNLSNTSMGMATMEEIRNAILDFKESGKWVVAYSEIYSQGAFYLASTADEIYMYPEGMLDFRGLNVEIMFMKNALEKLDIEPQIIRGSNNKFKSAVEPLILEEMSQANRVQTEKWLNGLWSTMLTGIADSYGKSPEEIDALAQEYAVQRADDAVELGLVTALKYEDEVKEILRGKLELDEEDDLALVSLPKYFSAEGKKDDDKKRTFELHRDKVAVVYATGGIESGKGDNTVIGSETFQKAIRSARQDTTVKAIVLRVNSPGGSALASDVIWRETVLAKAEKPVVVSMGDVAASGGYYIACAADKIIAMPNTITGSIGVFGVLPNMKGFFNEKLGLTFDGVKTNQYADFGQVTRPMTSNEELILQKSVDDIYDVFLSHVAEGRGMTVEYVDSIGQGRVWSGIDALELGLVDDLGGLDYAIEEAARLAGIEDYDLRAYPERKDFFEQFMQEFADAGVKNFVGKLFMDPELVRYQEEIRTIKNMEGVQARMPYSLVIR